MQAATFWRTVTMDHADFLEQTIQVLEEAGALYCVIDGPVNAYAESSFMALLFVYLGDPEAVRTQAIHLGPVAEYTREMDARYGDGT